MTNVPSVACSFEELEHVGIQEELERWVWFTHCHLEKHVSWGMGTAFIILNGNTPETSMLPKPNYMPKC
ncbi:hypothetical protein MLD38_010389 [Melastoma candidum]|uniref:Uncharacterized protein n=1 Tax=Melastoma candidum TaxID=119954 RepID=A0ACB9R2S3_9MYRT|nr:hypothetical protein MLD38_010389 [Melastoma candidum]